MAKIPMERGILDLRLNVHPTLPNGHWGKDRGASNSAGLCKCGG